jgi:hypothetical protein
MADGRHRCRNELLKFWEFENIWGCILENWGIAPEPENSSHNSCDCFTELLQGNIIHYTRT